MINIAKAITSVNKATVWLVGILIFAMSILLTVDVILRYFFKAPTSWAFELSTWGTGVIAFSLGGYALLAGQHVRVDLYFEKLSRRQKSLVDVISALLLFVMVGSMIWLGTDYVLHYQRIGAVVTGGFAMPLWVQWLIIPLGGLLLGLQGLVKFIDDLHIIATGEKFFDTRGGAE